MAQSNDIFGMLDLMDRPGFCVKDQKIVKVNSAAQLRMLTPGEDIAPLLHTGNAEYSEFTGGCLYLTLKIADQIWGASVTRMGDTDVFLLEQEEDQTELRAMALAALELREPLTSVMTIADDLLPAAAEQVSDEAMEKVARLNRGLYQMLRIIFNMSDASRYTAAAAPTETRNVCALLEDVFNSASGLISQAGLNFNFTNYPQPIFCLADKEKLERAVLNILSNAIKFTPAGGTIDAKLAKKGNLLVLTVQDSGEGVTDSLKGSIFNRFRRIPTIEDGRFGIGLGMVLIRSAAAQHGGTVLVDQPENQGIRVTMTMAIRENKQSIVRSPLIRVDYAGGRDHRLIELSDSLPATAFDCSKSN